MNLDSLLADTARKVSAKGPVVNYEWEYLHKQMQYLFATMHHPNRQRHRNHLTLMFSAFPLKCHKKLLRDLACEIPGPLHFLRHQNQQCLSYSCKIPLYYRGVIINHIYIIPFDFQVRNTVKFDSNHLTSLTSR